MKKFVQRLISGTFVEPAIIRLFLFLIKCKLIEPISSAAHKNYLYDLQTTQVMRKVLKRNTNCVDVGCHQGSILKQILRLSPAGLHFAFEPLPEMYADLNKIYGSNTNVRIFNCALSASIGEKHFQHVISNPGYSGFLRRTYDIPNAVVHQIKVNTDLLDNIIPESIEIGFIKIDVEGAELEVLQGSINTIRRCKPMIIFEHGLGAAEHYGTTPEKIYELIVEKIGLRLFRLDGWLTSNGAACLAKFEFCRLFYSGEEFYFLAAK